MQLAEEAVADRQPEYRCLEALVIPLIVGKAGQAGQLRTAAEPVDLAEILEFKVLRGQFLAVAVAVVAQTKTAAVALMAESFSLGSPIARLAG